MKNGVFRTRLQYNSYSVGFYQNDMEEGLFKIFDNQGTLCQEIEYVGGVPHGIKKRYYHSRVIIKELFIDGDKKEEKHFFDDGSLYLHYIFREQKKNGKFVEYYQDGSVRAECNYIADNPVGEFINYYQNGMIEKKQLYTENRIYLLEEYYDNGQLARIITWQTDPQENGVDNKFHPNGQPKKTSEYRNGLLEGDVIEHYDNGQIKSKWHYVKGKKDGTFTDYFKNGNVQQISNYSRNQLHGEFKKYRHKDGALIADYEHEKGKRKRQREEDEDEEDEE